MWPQGNASSDADTQALSQTPCDLRVDGFWRITEDAAHGPIVSSCRIRQSGVTVDGVFNSKWAGAGPITIRGIVSEGHVLATWHRPGKQYSGSGVLRLAVDAAAGVMHGTGTWHSAEAAEPGLHRLRWQRVAT